MPFSNPFVPVDFVNESVTPTGTPDIDSAFLNYLQSIVDAQGDGLATYSSDLEALQSTVTALGTPYTDQGFITGLSVDYLNSTQLTISSGACYVPGVGSITAINSDTTYTPTGLAANTLYNVYASSSLGTLTFTHSTTAPATYFGNAKQMSGDSTRRFIGSFRTRAAATTLAAQYTSNGNHVMYRPSLSGSNFFTAPYFLGTRGDVTVITFSVAPLVPVGTKLAFIQVLNYSNQTGVFGDPSTLSSTVYDNWSQAGGSTQTHWVSLTSSRGFGTRLTSVTTNGQDMNIFCTGYKLER